jgi:hypothetical protein
VLPRRVHGLLAAEEAREAPVPVVLRAVLMVQHEVEFAHVEELPVHVVRMRLGGAEGRGAGPRRRDGRGRGQEHVVRRLHSPCASVWILAGDARWEVGVGVELRL